MDWLVITSALVLGFLGGGHCIGMCGGIMAALSFSVPDASATRRFTLLCCYNLGRICSYALIGLLVGAVGASVSADSLWVLRFIAGGLLVAMGLYLASWWRGLLYLERAGQLLWRFVQPFSKRLLPVKTIPTAVALGFIWGWLPCGLVYTALAYAMAQADAQWSALTMLAFGVGTLPAVLASGVLAERLQYWVRRPALRSFFAVLIIIFGVWTLSMAILHRGHDHAAAPGTVPESSPAMHHHH